MKLVITSVAKKQIKKLQKVYQIVIVQKIRKLGMDSTVWSEKLSGYKNFYRCRVGVYRIVYTKNINEIKIVLVAHRREVYLLLKRMIS